MLPGPDSDHVTALLLLVAVAVKLTAGPPAVTAAASGVMMTVGASGLVTLRLKLASERRLPLVPVTVREVGPPTAASLPAARVSVPLAAPAGMVRGAALMPTGGFASVTVTGASKPSLEVTLRVTSALEPCCTVSSGLGSESVKEPGVEPEQALSMRASSMPGMRVRVGFIGNRSSPICMKGSSL
jgi:hypothetical protein